MSLTNARQPNEEEPDAAERKSAIIGADTGVRIGIVIGAIGGIVYFATGLKELSTKVDNLFSVVNRGMDTQSTLASRFTEHERQGAKDFAEIQARVKTLEDTGSLATRTLSKETSEKLTVIREEFADKISALKQDLEIYKAVQRVGTKP